MIHHISIAAHNPLQVARVLAEVLQGTSIPFPNHPGSYIALALDAQGTMIEVHPFGTALFPGNKANEAGNLLPHPSSSPYTANHTAISVPVSIDQIQAIADREGWRMVRCNRSDYFEVIEFWLENLVLIELLPPEIINQYLKFMKPQALQELARAIAVSE